MQTRIIGIDIARAIAVFGMVLVNFTIVMNATSGNSILLYLSSLFEGRASALFVVLSGVGISLLTVKNRVSEQANLINTARLALLKRGLALFAVGLMLVPIWPADILHFYGAYFLIAACFFNLKSQHLLSLTVLFILGFVVLLLLLNYDQGWHWPTLNYRDFWTLPGMMRHLMFNGFHPVFPWCAFLLFGLWLGRQPLLDSTVQVKLASIAAVIWLVVELSIKLLREHLLTELALGRLSTKDLTDFAISATDIAELVNTQPMPPLPSYMLASGSLAVIIIILCVYIGQQFSRANITRWLADTGQLALTLYLAHIFIGMGALETLGFIHHEATLHLSTTQTQQPIELSLLFALLFNGLAVVFSVFWLKYFTRGPVEWLFHKITK